ncbi:MAG: N-acetylmuramoyl-L-alanine amidase, partial [Opitutales bacterium]
NETDIAATQTYYNGRAIGIECAGWSRRSETWTPELLEALVNLTAYLCAKWEVPAYHPEGTAHEGSNRIALDNESQQFTGQGLVGHFQVQPWNKSDPGSHFPWEEFGERVRERIREYGLEPIALPSADDAEVEAGSG